MSLPVWVRTLVTICKSTGSRCVRFTPAKSRTRSYAMNASSTGTGGVGNARLKRVYLLVNMPQLVSEPFNIPLVSLSMKLLV